MVKNNFILILFVMASVTVSAQKLTGTMDAYGAWNFNRGHKENAALKLNFDSTIYYVHVGIDGGYNYTPTTENTGIVNDNGKDRSYSVKTDENQITTRKWNARVQLDFGYHLSNRDLLMLGARYAYSGRHREENLNSSRYLTHINPDLVAQLDTLDGMQHDLTVGHQHNLDVNLDYKHQFSTTRSVYVLLGTHQAMGGDNSERAVKGSMFAFSRDYYETNVLGESQYRVLLHYDDLQLGGVENLRMNTGIELLFYDDIDQYRTDCREEQHVDTTILNFHRAYLSQYTEPFVKLHYSIKNWDFTIHERPQIYSNLQWELLSVASPFMRNRKTWFSNLADVNIGYQFQPKHRFDLSYSYSVKHPDYKQFSSVLRMSNTEAEFIQGNDSLRPEKTHKLNFRYTYKPGKHLLTTLDVFYGNKKEKIEKVVTVKEAMDKELITIKTFTNDNTQHSVGGALRLKLKYEAVEAEAWSSVAWERFSYYRSAKPKDELSYKLGLLLNAHLNKAVDLTSSIVYVSPTRSAYNEKNEYIGADIRLTYRSPVGVSLFVEANDIINKPRTETTWNESLTYMKVKEVYENRNCLGVGIRYEF